MQPLPPWPDISPEDLVRQLGAVLKDEREPMKQDVLAERAGVNVNTVRNVEQGVGTSRGFIVVAKLCRALNVDPRIILEWAIKRARKHGGDTRVKDPLRPDQATVEAQQRHLVDEFSEISKGRATAHTQDVVPIKRKGHKRDKK